MKDEKQRVSEPASQPRIYESRSCWACGEPSWDQKYCTVCAEEIAMLERCYGGDAMQVPEECECAGVSAEPDRLSMMLLDEQWKMPRWMLTASNVLAAVFLAAVAIWLLGCIAKGFLWASAQ